MPHPRQVSVGKRECGIWMPAWVAESTVVHRLTHKVKQGIGNDRWARVAQVGDLGLIATHANAVIRFPGSGRWRETSTSREWRENGLPRLSAVIRDHGGPLILGADMNAHDKGESSPRHFFDQHGLESTNVGLMWAAWSPAYRLTRREVIGRPPGSDDHQALLLTFELKES